MYKLLTVILFFFCVSKLIAQDTLYFDKDWNESTKASHEYYRPLPLKKVGELLYIQDYHKNGHLQMQAYVLADNPGQYVGDIYWYDTNGLDNGLRQYLNKTAIKELTYYNPDGGIWQIITYDDNGKKQKINVYIDNKIAFTGHIDTLGKLSGTFSSDFYASYHSRDYETTNNAVMLAPKMLEGAPLMEVDDVEVNSSQKQYIPAFHIVTLWPDGRKAQETSYAYTIYGGTPEKLQITSWNRDGKLLSEINHQELQNDTDKVYKEVAFYRQNNFATGIIGIVPMKNNSRHGQSVFYYLNGEKQTEEQYIEGEIQEIRFYRQDGILDVVSTYKAGQPFDGKFSDILGNKEVVYNMQKGVKQGQTYIRNIDTDQILFEGQHKDDEPYDGYFLVSEHGYLEKLQFKNGKQDGLQTIFYYYDAKGENVREAYQMKNGVREGFRKIYEENGELKFESFYRNGKVFSGTILDDDLTQSTFAGGNLLEVRICSPYDHEKPIAIKKYTDNQLASITYYDFTIAEKQQDHYTGIYKNGQPYEGYFKLDTLIDKIPLIDYYENGELKYKYAFEFLDQLESYEHYTYDKKATFQNGKVLDGPTYKLVGKERLITTHHQDEELIGFDANLFAMHYFNRISFKKENNILSISEMQAPLKLAVSIVNNAAVAKAYDGETLVKNSKPIQELKPEEGKPNSVTLYYLDNGQIRKFIAMMDITQGTLDNESFAGSLLGRIFYLFPIPNQADLDTVFDRFLINFQKPDIDQIFEMDSNSTSPINDDNYLSYLEYDVQGKPHAGVKISPQKDGTILLEALSNGKVFETVKVKNTEELLTDDKAILRKLENAILKIE